MTALIEKFLQLEIHHDAEALSNIGLGLGDRLMGVASWPKPVTALRKRRVPTPLHPLEQGLLDEAVKDTRNPQLAFLLAAWFGSLHPFHHTRLIRAFRQLVFDPRPVRSPTVGQGLDAHAVEAWTSLVRTDLPERRLHVGTLQHLFHHVLTKQRAFGCL